MASLPEWVASGRGSLSTGIKNSLQRTRYMRSASTKLFRLRRRVAWGLMLLCDETQQQLKSVLRQYPDGLVKVEPGDFGRLVLPVPRRIVGAIGEYREAVGYLVSGDVPKAIAIANRFI